MGLALDRFEEPVKSVVIEIYRASREIGFEQMMGNSSPSDIDYTTKGFAIRIVDIVRQHDSTPDPLSGDEPVGTERGETDLSDGFGCASCEGD